MSAATAGTGSRIRFSNNVSQREYNKNNETRKTNSIQPLKNKNTRHTRRRTGVRPFPMNMNMNGMLAYLDERNLAREERNLQKGTQKALRNLGAINASTYEQRKKIINREMNARLNAYLRELMGSASTPAATGGGSAAAGGAGL